jgi:outer membrane protein TolC
VTGLALLLLGCLTLAPVAIAESDTPPETDEPEFETEISGGLDTGAFQIVDDQLRRLIETALTDNPRLSSAWMQSQSSFERVPQERSLPDLQLGYRYFVWSPETRTGPQLHAFELVQPVPWGGKRRLQAERAENLAASRTWDAEDLERRLVADIKRTYYEAAYLQEAIRVNGEEQELLRRFESIALKRYSTGQGIQQSVVKVQTEISRLDDRRTDLRERLDLATRRLAERTGSPESVLVLDPIDLPFPEVDPDREGLEQVAVAEHPRVRAVEQRIAGDRAWADRRKLESRPDFRFGVGYTLVGEREDMAGRIDPPEGNGDDILGLTVGINIPIHGKRIRAGVAEAQQSERAARDLLAAVRNELRYEVQQATLELDSLRERGRLYGEVIIPQAEESLASAEAAYTTDRLSFLDLLDAQRVLFQSRLAYHRLVADIWIALAELELAAARPIPSPAGASRSTASAGAPQ